MSKVLHSAILSTFIKQPFGIKIFVMSIFEWPLKTGFTVDQRRLVLICTFLLCHELDWFYRCTVVYVIA